MGYHLDERGPLKTELQVPEGCDPDSLPLPLHNYGRPLPAIVPGFKACLGVPRHPSNCDAFIKDALLPLAQRHDNLIDLGNGVSDEDPYAAMRLLQVCGFKKFGHVLFANPPESTISFCERRHAEIADTLGVIYGTLVDPDQSTHALLVVAGGARLPSLLASASSSYLGAFFRIAGLPTTRLAIMGGTTRARAATLLADPAAVSDSYGWAANHSEIHSTILALQYSFTGPQLHITPLVAPRRNIIHSSGDPGSIALALTLALDMDVTPALTEASRAPKGVRFVSAGLRRLQDWRTFLSVLADAPLSTQPKLLSHYGQGSVDVLVSDIPLGRSVSPPLARCTIRHICGATTLGDIPLGLRSPSCP